MFRVIAGVMISVMVFSATVFADTITVAAAGNLQYVLPAVISAYEKATGDTVKPVFASSGKLFAQISAGAPYDVFLSADMKYPAKLFSEGYAKSVPAPYAAGRIVMWSKTVDMTPGSSALVGVTTLSMPNPSLAPYGAAAVQWMEKVGVADTMKSKTVLTENLMQSLQHVDSGVADVAVVAYSQVLSPKLAGVGSYYLIDAEAHDPLMQGFVVLQENPAALRFAEYLKTFKADAVFAAYGYAEVPATVVEK